MAPDNPPRAEKSIIDPSDIIDVFSGKAFDKIKEVTGIAIATDEIIAFADAHNCFEDIDGLARHICLVLIEAIEHELPDIFRNSVAFRKKIKKVVDVVNVNAFKDLHVPKSARNERLYSLAAEFLNLK